MITPNPFEIIDKRLSNIESLLLDLKHGELKPQYLPVKKQLLKSKKKEITATVNKEEVTHA